MDQCVVITSGLFTTAKGGSNLCVHLRTGRGQNVASLHKGTPFSLEKEQRSDTCCPRTDLEGAGLRGRRLSQRDESCTSPASGVSRRGRRGHHGVWRCVQ